MCKKNAEIDGNAEFVGMTRFGDYEIEKMYEDTKKIRSGLRTGVIDWKSRAGEI